MTISRDERYSVLLVTLHKEAGTTVSHSRLDVLFELKS